MGWLRRVPVLDSAVPMLCPSYSGVPTGGLAQALSTWGLRKVEPGQAGNGAAQMPRNREFLERRAEQRLPACRRAYLDCTAHFRTRDQLRGLSCPLLLPSVSDGRPASVLLRRPCASHARLQFLYLSPRTLRNRPFLPLCTLHPFFHLCGCQVAQLSAVFPIVQCGRPASVLLLKPRFMLLFRARSKHNLLCTLRYRPFPCSGISCPLHPHLPLTGAQQACYFSNHQH